MKDTKRKVAFHTLGCKLNFAETSTIARSFPLDKFEMVSPGEKADIYVINTCSVTDTADRKCRQAIKKFVSQSPEALIAVVGCYAQLKPAEIAAIAGVDLVLGASEKFNKLDSSLGDRFTSVNSRNILDKNNNPIKEKQSFQIGETIYLKVKINKEKESHYKYSFDKPKNYDYRSKREQ